MNRILIQLSKDKKKKNNYPIMGSKNVRYFTKTLLD